MSTKDSEEWTETISCLFCAGLGIAIMASIPIALILHLSGYEFIILFLGTIFVSFLLLYLYNRKAFFKVVDMATD